MPSLFDTVLEAPFDRLGVCIANDVLCGLAYLPENTPIVDSPDALTARLACRPDVYYVDARVAFDIPLTLAGTDLQLRMW